MNAVLRPFTAVLCALAALLTPSLQAADEGAPPPESPSTAQCHPQTPTGDGGQGSSAGSIGCCCCCPKMKVYDWGIFGKWTLPAYPGCDMLPVIDPVVLTDGKLYVPYNDVEIPGPGRFNHVNLKFHRSYNSRDNFQGVLGWGWVTNLDINLSFSGGGASLKDWDGTRYFMQYSSSILYADGQSRAGFVHGPFTLEQVTSPAAAFVLTKTFGTRYIFASTTPCSPRRRGLERNIQDNSQVRRRRKLIELGEVQNFQQFCEAETNGLRLIFSERGGKGLAEIARTDAVTLAIGPEGGWSESELKFSETQGFMPVHLGNRILRTETAAVAAVKGMNFRLGLSDGPGF